MELFCEGCLGPLNLLTLCRASVCVNLLQPMKFDVLYDLTDARVKPGALKFRKRGLIDETGIYFQKTSFSKIEGTRMVKQVLWRQQLGRLSNFFKFGQVEIKWFYLHFIYACRIRPIYRQRFQSFLAGHHDERFKFLSVVNSHISWIILAKKRSTGI